MAKKLTKQEIAELTNHQPKSRYPRNLEDSYAREIIKLVKQWQKDVNFYVKTFIKPDVVGGTKILNDANNNNDDDSWIDRLERNLKFMVASILGTTSDKEINNITSKFVKSVNNFQYHNINAQASKAGIKAVLKDKHIDEYMKLKIKQNTDLIKTMEDKYLDDLRKDIYRSVTDSGGITDITKAITNRTSMAVRHARLIANDQTGKILGQMNKYRATHAGAERYIWQSMEDNRVRAKHQILDQTVQKYDDPNSGDEGSMPGEPINCRCIAEPIF